MSKTDVLIVGAGPVGLTMAIECHRHGVNFRIIEKNPSVSHKSKALAIWSGTLECFAAMGVLEEFQKRSSHVDQLVFMENGRFINRALIHEGVDSLFPEPVVLPQNQTEEILIEKLGELGANLERCVELIGFKNETDRVEAAIRHPDGSEETITVQWMIGCDGGRSFVRHQLPVQFPGVTEHGSIMIVDAKVEGELPERSLFANWGATSGCGIIPIRKGFYRVGALRPVHKDQEPTLEEMQAILDNNGLSRLKLKDPEWLACFRVNERFVTQVRVGRVILAGDAAHVHSPLGGQGMNTGIQDAYNIGWKLGLLIRGKGNPELLADSIHAERNPVAKAVVEKTRRLLHMAIINNALARLAKRILLGVIFQFRFVHKRLSAELSEIHITYPKSPLIVPDVSWPTRRGFKPGSRPRNVEVVHPETGETLSLWNQFLGTRHTLIIFSGKDPRADTFSEVRKILDSLQPYETELRVILVTHKKPDQTLPDPLTVYLDPNLAAHNRYGLGKAGWYLIRPDQFSAARSPTLNIDSLMGYVKKTVA